MISILLPEETDSNCFIREEISRREILKFVVEEMNGNDIHIKE